jgi:inhibitor of KinA sporulation pathway (predicted exonuclease)
MPTLALPGDPPLSTWPDKGLIGILDLEYTAWEGSAQRQWSEPWEWREIVQVGLLLVDAGRAFAATDGIEVLVQPTRNPVLSKYFVTLTGITQSHLVAKARPFAEAMDDLSGLLSEAELVVFNGYDGAIFRENCELNGVAFRWGEDRWRDFRPLLARTLNVPPHKLTSSDLPGLAGISVHGRAHSALHDCKAIAAAFSTWRASGRL